MMDYSVHLTAADLRQRHPLYWAPWDLEVGDPLLLQREHVQHRSHVASLCSGVHRDVMNIVCTCIFRRSLAEILGELVSGDLIAVDCHVSCLQLGCLRPMELLDMATVYLCG